MDPKEPSMPHLARLLLDVYYLFDKHDLQPVVGGALAGNYYRTPRETIEIDMNVNENGEDHRALQILERELGVEISAHHIESAVSGAQSIGIELGYDVDLDLFFRFTREVSDFVVESSRIVKFAGKDVRILSPECLLIMKAAFNRTKDWDDIEQIVRSTPVDLNNLQVFADLVMGMEEELYRIKSLVLKARQLDGKLAF